MPTLYDQLMHDFAKTQPTEAAHWQSAQYIKIDNVLTAIDDATGGASSL